jgi:hypothetical protein
MDFWQASGKFEIEYSYERVHFLDTSIYQLESDLFSKPADKALLLHKESFHPNNFKTSIIYSQARRYVRLITNRNSGVEVVNILQELL